MSSSMRQVERLHYILTLMDMFPQGVTVRELHKLLTENGSNVSLRTVRRDLDGLTLANYPIYEAKEGRVSRYFLKKKETLTQKLTNEDLLSVYFLQELLSPVSQYPVFQNAYQFLNKAVAGLPNPDAHFIKKLKQHYIVDITLIDPEEKISQDIFQNIHQAIFSNRVIEACYHTFYSDTITDREIEPFNIILCNRHYYLVGYCRQREDVRDFRISRFLNVKIKEERCHRRDNFSYKAYSKNTWNVFKGKSTYDLEIKFSPQKARFIKEYHEHQADRLEELPDSSLLFYRCVDSLEEVVPWVLSFGSAAKVLKPLQLKKEVAEHTKKMAAIYY